MDARDQAGLRVRVAPAAPPLIIGKAGSTSSRERSRLEISVENARQYLHWLPDFEVIVCSDHGYAIGSVAQHLRIYHTGSDARKREVADMFSRYRVRRAKEVSLPRPQCAPFAVLGKPIRTYICEAMDCTMISRSEAKMRQHCKKDHSWRATKKQRTLWRPVWAQTFFNAAGLQRYFTVEYEEEEEGVRNGEAYNNDEDGAVLTPSVHNAESDDVVSNSLSQWNATLHKHEKDLEVADLAIAKTDHTLWFKRNQWPEHVKGRNLRHLSQASRLPDRDEELLRKAVDVNNALIERCVRGLSTLDLEVRRWLRSAKQSEPDVRPLARLQNKDSQDRYASYMARLLCYALRVLESSERLSMAADDEFRREESARESVDDGDSEYSAHTDSSGTNNSPIVVDVMKDARELFPWHRSQKAALQTFRETLSSDAGDETQQDALLEFYSSIVFQKVRGDTFVSILLHFLAVLGIDEELNRLRQANDFSYMLAGVVYCVRLLAIEKLMPSADRDAQTESDDQNFRRMRDAYLADGSFSAMSKMLSLLAYSKSLALNHSNAGAVFWSEDRACMYYKGKPLELRRFREFAQSIVQKAETQLQSLMRLDEGEHWELALHELRDDVTFTKRGWSFMQTDGNKLQDRRQWLLRKALSPGSRFGILKKGELSMPAVRRCLREVERFRELLLLCMHICGGQPARGTEITSLRFRNGFMQDRNVFIIDGQVVFVTRYHKSQSQFDKPKVIPRFLPARVGQLLVMYIVYVQALQEYLNVTAFQQDWTDYIWSRQGSPWETERLTRIIRRESELQLGFGLTTHDYRHVAISIGREVVGSIFAKGYQEGMDEHTEHDEAEEDGTGDALEVSAGRGAEVGTNRYGVPLDVIKHLSNKTVDTFRPLSAKWHRFLGFGGTASLNGQKRKSHLRGSSVDVAAEVYQSERRRLAAVRNNDLGEQLRSLSSRWAAVQGSELTGPDQARGSFGNTAEASGQVSASLALQPSPVRGVSLQRSSPPSGPPNVESTVSRRLFVPGSRGAVSEEQIRSAVQKALGVAEYSFRSAQQESALRAILEDEQTPLVVVLPTGGGKSLLFMAPACLEDPGVTIVVVPFRALLNKLLKTAQDTGINSIEWRPGERNPAALVFISADLVSSGTFMGYAQMLSIKNMLRRVFVDESHVTFTDSDWRVKLSHVREVRRLQCPTIMLTATLPVLMEAELEASMSTHHARYIRAPTTRLRTRYIVHRVKPGTLLDEVLSMCRRMKKHLGLQKGVVYSRSRSQCESLAEEIGCAYYHAGAVDNQERLDSWLSHGGLIVATSALGTGVDFPGIVFVLHVDLPYGLIDFAQESGRGGRAGEDVDSVIIVEEGRVEQLAARMHGIDNTVMGEFVTTRQCRRMVMGAYLDGKGLECSDAMARCDRCGEGITAIFREHSQAASQRARFEHLMDELTDSQGCMECLAGNVASWPDHRWEECSGASAEMEVDRFRAGIRFEAKTHSCFKCGISQKLCRTGVGSLERCQWPGTARLLMGLGKTAVGFEVARRCGFEGEQGDLEAFGRWVGRAHRGRIWNEVMSNGMFLIKEFSEWRAGLYYAAPLAGQRVIEEVVPRERGDVSASITDTADGVEESEKEEQPVRRGAGRGQARRAVVESDSEDPEQAGVWDFTRVLDRWKGVCIICLAVHGVRRSTHSTDGCVDSAEQAETVRWGIRQMEGMREPEYEQGRCWTGFIRCREEGGVECIRGKLAREVGIALLYGGKQRSQIQDWVAKQHHFEGRTHEEAVGELGVFLRRAVGWREGVEGNMLCEMIWRFGSGSSS